MSEAVTGQAPRVALVTGGSRGIGRAICQALAGQGCDVGLVYARNREEADQTVALCRAAAHQAGHSDARFAVFGGDVGDASACEELFAACTESLGAPDILVNNAGITKDNLILRMSVDDFDAVMQVNLRAAFVFSKLAARPMVKKRYGRIISISSVVGMKGNAGQVNYAASKAGLIGLTKSLAKELGSRYVTVNAVAPGFIETSMTKALSEDAKGQLTDAITIPRLGTPQDVAALVAFLASDAAGYITGQVIPVDGGLVL